MALPRSPDVAAGDLQGAVVVAYDACGEPHKFSASTEVTVN